MMKILVIEDEESIRNNIIEFLEAENFEALSAENGLVGVKIARDVVPDLIICDVMMPHLDGYGVLTALRQDPVTAIIPFIFLSAKVDRADVRHGMQLGADDYVTKPCTPSELLSAIAARINRVKAITQPYTIALKKAAERLNHLLHHDSVTNLPNRLLLRERFDRIVGTASKTHHSIPLLFLGLDRFNRISDNLGNQSSDRIIQEVAERITACLSTQDTVARLNADQFAIVMATLSERQTVASVAQAIISSLNDPFTVETGELFLTASIGIAFYSTDAKDLNNLMKKAYAAMAHSQKLEGNHSQFYTTDIDVRSGEVLALEGSLRRALERDELQVYYQPIVNLQTGKIIGAEALLRWQHPQRGYVSPAEFIPLAEETGLIVPIGEWVLQTACTQTQKWHTAGFSSFQISVNLSGRQFSQPHLSQRIVRILETVGLEPTALELELTESILVENADVAIATLKELKQSGIQIAIDDFGTGYASLGYLKQFPFDTLKIDQCFVRDVTSDTHNTAITIAVIQMAHNLNLKVTAEGVETQAELTFLCHHQCDSMQGYLFSRPVTASDFESLLLAGKSLSI